MRILRDPVLLQQYIEKQHIDEIFDTRDLPFCLVEYEAGEVMNILQPQEDYLKFIVDGKISIVDIQEDGNSYQYFYGDTLHMFGDLEFCGYAAPTHWQEVAETVRALELPLRECRSLLWQDLHFLQYLAKSLASSVSGLSGHVGVSLLPAKERVLNYLRYTAPDHSIRKVGQTAYQLHCSPRQLIRILQEYVSEGIVVKKGKGYYTLVSGDSFGFFLL